MLLHILVALFAVLSVVSCPVRPTPSSPTPSLLSPIPSSSTPSSLIPSSPTPSSPTPSSPTPTPTTSPTPAKSYTPSSTPAASTTSSSTPSSTSSAPGTATGQHITWYNQDGNAGSCGETHTDDDLVVAMNPALYNQIGAKNICSMNVTITSLLTGATVIAPVRDLCTGCSDKGWIDTSVKLFEELSGNKLSLGTVQVVWDFVY